jgi:hypothetical protein
MHRVTSDEQHAAPQSGERARWRPTGTPLSLAMVKQICIRLLTIGDGPPAVPGLALSRNGTAWSNPRPCVKVTGLELTTPPRCTYFVPAARELERIRAEASVQVRVGVFAERATDGRIAISILSDDDTISSSNMAGDHQHLNCAELAADIAQHREVLAQLEALCSLGSDDFDFCFLRDVAARDLADAEQAYQNSGCAGPSV